MFTHLYLELTSACNLSCKHCCIGDKPFSELGHVTKLLKDFSDKGEYVTLSGGEPLLREDWAEIANLCIQLGYTTTVFTNGTLVEEHLQSLVDIPVHVAISIDGLDESKNWLLRGNSHSKIMRSINSLVEAGKEREMALSYTPTPFNLDQLELLVDFAVSKEIEHFHVSFLEVRGRAGTKSSLELSDKEKVRLMEMLFELAHDYEGIITLELSEGTDLLYDTWNFGKNLLENPLGKTLKFTADGNVYTSTFVEGDLFWLGVYPDQSLDELLQSPKIAELSSDIRKRHEVVPECNECIFGPVCCAGVYTLAYNKHGTIWVPDEYCKGNQAIFEKVIQEMKP